MPLHDFYCPACHRIWPDRYVPVQTRASEAGLRCPDCDRPVVWIAAAPALHYGSVKTAAFKAFDTTDGYGRPVHIDSLTKLRRVEKEAEQAFRNGEGQPMVFRAWANDQASGNKLDPVLHPSYAGGEQPTPEAKRKFGSTLRKGETDPRFGPGVSEANASALAMSGKED